MNIIGIVGQKNSGKSTVAKMIAELTPGTVEVQLAEPLKRFCADVFDWKDDVLNGPSELREREDNRYPRGWYCTRCHTVGPTSLCCAPGCLSGALSTTPIYLTPRFALQRLGTEWGRACYADVWIDYALRACGQMSKVEGRYCSTCKRPRIEHTVDCPNDAPAFAACLEFKPDWFDPLVIIPDVRFVNEARKIRAAGGQVWRVRRDEKMRADDTHASEREQFSAEMDQYVNYTIVNTGTLDQLRTLVKLNLTGELTGANEESR